MPGVKPQVTLSRSEASRSSGCSFLQWGRHFLFPGALTLAGSRWIPTCSKDSHCFLLPAQQWTEAS